MRFGESEVRERRIKLIEELTPKLTPLGFKLAEGDFIWLPWFHQKANINLNIVPVKERGSYSFYTGFRFKAERSYHFHRRVVFVKLENIESFKTMIDESIAKEKRYDDSRKESSDRTAALTKKAESLFPGKYIKVDRSTIHVSSRDHKGMWFSVDVDLTGNVTELKVSYPGKTLEQMVKLLESW